ncbi:hypothetical protein JQC67_08805 [Aurantibacter crassamenti]|uniref:hypothetical protein n=1 Tax=Aurantibacter crassamenti TaxID=1837375 RepID=UPI0019398D3E|nr:hypothetical protein [Aurantibacter crassamenti]MBM1106233.1 hypothetical protein [Aurantibacter crassamenti]
MKRLYSLLAILAIIFVANCTRIPENNNPIIGVWNDNSISLADKSSETTHHEWIFNDAYLGRFQSYNENKISFKTDFKWSVKDDVYTISYPGTDLPSHTVSMKGSTEGDMLALQDGIPLAIREEQL